MGGCPPHNSAFILILILIPPPSSPSQCSPRFRVLEGFAAWGWQSQLLPFNSILTTYHQFPLPHYFQHPVKNLRGMLTEFQRFVNSLFSTASRRCVARLQFSYDLIKVFLYCLVFLPQILKYLRLDLVGIDEFRSFDFFQCRKRFARHKVPSKTFC